jgi:C1A family cysteine protease
MKVVQFVSIVVCIVSVGLAASAQEAQRGPITAGEPGKGGFVSWIDTSKLVVPADLPKPGLSAPPNFDWRTVGTTPAKDQGSCGVCWIFAGMGDLESKVKIALEGEFDYSEQEVLDCNPSGLNCVSMGNAWGYFNHINQECTVLEADYPYTGTKGSCAPIAAKHKRGLQMRTLADDSAGPARDWIKDTIMNEGPVYTSVYSSFYAFQTHDGTYGMYYPPETTNHAVLLVGWDDTMPYYLTYPGTPTGYGCWIIKNSWGTAWGQNGFGYIGYGAAGIATHNSYISQYNSCSYDYGEILRYDDGFRGSFWGYGTVYNPQAAVQYASTSSEDITGVGLWVSITDADYEIALFDDANPSTNTWTSQLAYKSGSLTEGGYHMIDLDSAVPIPVDNDFWVRIRIIDPNTTTVYLIAGDDTAPIESGKCFMSPNGSSWQDTSGFGPAIDVGIHPRLGEPAPLTTPTPTWTPREWSGTDKWEVYR